MIWLNRISINLAIIIGLFWGAVNFCNAVEPDKAKADNTTLTGKWHHPTSLTDSLSLPKTDAMATTVTMNSKGNGIVVWSQFDGSNWRIYRAEYNDGKWQKPGSMSDAVSLAGANAKEPRVAMNVNGDAVIVWEQVANKKSHVFMAEKRDGIWRKPASIEDHISPGNSFAWEPEVAMDGQGNTVIVWNQEYNDGFHNIYKREYRDGSWTNPAIDDHINHRGGDATRPKVVVNNKNVALITWEQDPGGQSHIYKSEYRNGTWSHPTDINDHINPKDEKRSRAHHAIPSINDKGEAVIAWQQAHGTYTRVYLSEYRQGKWDHPESLADSISPEKGFNASLKDVEMDNNGNNLIIWKLQVKRNHALYMSEYRNGKWSHPQADDFFSGFRRPFEFWTDGTAAISDSGKSVVAWQEMGVEKINKPLFAEYDNGSWNFPGKSFTVNDQPASNVNVVGSRNGNFVISWIQRNKSGKMQVYTSVFTKIKK